MLLLRTRQIRPAPAAARAQSMTKRAVRAELRLAQFRRVWITYKWILVLSTYRRGESQEQQCSARRELED